MRTAFVKIACLLYESLILIALLLLVTLVFVAIFGDATAHPKKSALQLTLWLSMGVCFVWQWTHGGQTLAMKTWKLQVSTQNGDPISLRQGIIRYFVASIFFGLSFLWALFDRNHQYLHDRIAGTHIQRMY